MLMKRHYKKPDGWVRVTDDKGECVNVPPLDYVEIQHTGRSQQQNLSGGMIELGLVEGWIDIDMNAGLLTVIAKPENLLYKIVRVPGRYCCYCGEKLGDDTSGEIARGHVRRYHSSEVSPDTQNPAGYCMLNYYECMLNDKQHEKFKV
jgi:hypothetical protein